MRYFETHPMMEQITPVTVARRLVSTTASPPAPVEMALHGSYVVLTALMSSLSVAGAVATICTCLLVADMRRRRLHLLVSLSVADGLTASGNLLGVVWVGQGASLGSTYCVFHSALTNYSR